MAGRLNRRRFIERTLAATAVPVLVAPAEPLVDPSRRAAGSEIAPIHLRSEYRSEPLALNTAIPRLSWNLNWARAGARQHGYQVQAASSLELLVNDKPDLWDSREVTSAETLSIRYAGKALESRGHAFWRVRAWNESGNASNWSSPARFGIGLLDASDWQARWIGAAETAPLPHQRYFRNHDPKAGPVVPERAPAVYLVRDVTIDGPVSQAHLHICGLGYSEFYVDGHKAGDSLLAPPFTNYDKTVCYQTYDVTHLLTPGHHTLCAILGNGFFNLIVPDLFHMHEAPWRMSPRLLAQLEIVSPQGRRQTVVSDTEWKLASGPIVFNCVRGGETIDSRIPDPALDLYRPSYASLPRAKELRAPTGRLVAQQVPPIRITDHFRPIAITQLQPDLYLADFGRNLAGWTRYCTSGPAGTRITLDHNEGLKADGTLDTELSTSHTHGRYQQQACILSGRAADQFEPRFTYHAFRYVQIRGAAARPDRSDLQAQRMHTDLKRTGIFECSHPQVNKLHDACVRTLEDCTWGMPCAEPVREKVGWNGDTLFTSDAYFSLFDCATLYRQHVALVRDAQEANGHVPPIFPTNGWGNLDEKGGREFCDDPWWGGCLADSVRLLDEYYADRATMQAAYEDCARYLAYLSTSAQGEILDWHLGDWLDAGWKNGIPGNTPVPITATIAYFRLATLQSRMAQKLDKQEDARRYQSLAASIRKAFNNRFFDEKTASYHPGSQTAPALALHSGIVPDGQEQRVFAHLIEEIRAANNCMTTGFLGTMPLLYLLSERGEDDLAFKMVSGTDRVGWFWMLQGEFPTLAETTYRDFTASNSTHHHQYGACVAGYLYRCLAGIRAQKDYPGFERFVIAPGFPSEIDWVKASYESVRGAIGVSWRREGKELRLDVSVPCNTEATLIFGGQERTLTPGFHSLTGSSAKLISV